MIFREGKMSQDIESVQVLIKNKNIQAVDLKFCDLMGKWHHVTISKSIFNDHLLKSGVGFDGSSVGLKSVKSGDMVLIPDLSTAFLDPFWVRPTLSIICNIHEADTKASFPMDPRQVLRKAESFLGKTDLAGESLWGPEFEFYLFSKVAFENSSHVCKYAIDANEGFWNLGQEHFNTPLPVHGGYHAIPPGDQLYNIRSEIVAELETINVPIKYHHHEVGGPGQCEIETPMLGAIQAGDSAMLVKYFSRMVAQRHGLTATFLPKPLFGEAGSGMHFHQMLFKNGVNIFYDKEGYSFLSQIATYYVGGLLSHAPALLAFTNPSTNSYRRLIPGYEAPINCFFSSGNRSAAIRVPKYATEPKMVRIEFRPPDATCNPYFAIAAMLMAGIDGIKKKIDPTKASYGPFDDDLFSMPAEKQATIISLPTSLEDSLRALEKDNEFLLAGEVFSIELIHLWLNKKWSEEREVRIRPHPYEVQYYFDL
jgi:glutamine synthetase